MSAHERKRSNDENNDKDTDEDDDEDDDSTPQRQEGRKKVHEGERAADEGGAWQRRRGQLMRVRIWIAADSEGAGSAFSYHPATQQGGGGREGCMTTTKDTRALELLS